MHSARIKVGIDIGKSAIKFFDGINSGDVPSYSARGKLTQLVTGGNNGKTFTMNFKGADYILGEDAALGKGFTLNKDEKKSNEENLRLIMAVLHHLGCPKADIMVGLPVASYEIEKDDVKRIFNGIHEATVNDQKTTFDIRAGVIREPLGTYLSLITSPNGEFIPASPNFSKLIAVVDVGYKTIDVVLFRAGIQTPTMGSSMFGTSSFFERIFDDLSRTHGLLRENEKVEIQNILSSGTLGQLRVKGQEVGYAAWDKIRTHKKALAKDIIEYVKGVLSEITPGITLYTGGGSMMLRDELQSMDPGITFHNAARYSNAIGFYRALLIEETYSVTTAKSI
jgi:hypothetical protein